MGIGLIPLWILTSSSGLICEPCWTNYSEVRQVRLILFLVYYGHTSVYENSSTSYRHPTHFNSIIQYFSVPYVTDNSSTQSLAERTNERTLGRFTPTETAATTSVILYVKISLRCCYSPSLNVYINRDVNTHTLCLDLTGQTWAWAVWYVLMIISYLFL